MQGKYEKQFNSFYTDYQDMVYSLCRGFVNGDNHLAGDLVQEVFIRVWNALPEFKGKASPKTWIYRISVNTCLLHLRKQKNFQSQSLSEDQEAKHHADQDDSKDFQNLYSAINQLKETDRIIILLLLDELKYDEISEIVGIAEGALRVRIHRIKQKLNKILSDYEK